MEQQDNVILKWLESCVKKSEHRAKSNSLITSWGTQVHRQTSGGIHLQDLLLTMIGSLQRSSKYPVMVSLQESDLHSPHFIVLIDQKSKRGFVGWVINSPTNLKSFPQAKCSKSIAILSFSMENVLMGFILQFHQSLTQISIFYVGYSGATRPHFFRIPLMRRKFHSENYFERNSTFVQQTPEGMLS